ncbi:MAG: hypothetical protein ACLVKO_06845 [Dysgonomonas sp.]
MGIGIIPDDNSGIQLEMGGENSAFLPNRIALKSLDDLTTIPNPVDGMLIYNTTDNSALDLHPGIYYFGEGKWVSVFTSEVVSTIEYRDLSGNFSPNNTDTKAHERPDNATTLSWKDPNNPTLAASSYIEIPEDGSYAFSFRLYGSHVTNGPLREVFYLWALRNNSTLAADRLDVAELNIPLAYEATTNKRNLSYTVTLTAICRKGEKIYFRVGIPNNYPACTLIGNPKTSTSQDPVPNRTSMIFWKL